jgi:hypothetical protein
MPVATAVSKPEIQEGSLVYINLEANDETNAMRKKWAISYVWPMRVLKRSSPEHVVLCDSGGNVVHLGSTGDPSFHVCHLRLA